MSSVKYASLILPVMLLLFLNGCAWSQERPPTAEEVAVHTLKGIQDSVDIAARAYAHYAELIGIPMDKRKPIDDLHASYQMSMQAATRVVQDYHNKPTTPGALESAIRLAQSASNELIFQIYKHIE